jgi:hypothetical protein
MEISHSLYTLHQWTESFRGFFPDQPMHRLFEEWKIPVPASLIDPPATTRHIQTRCTQELVLACHYLIEARPAHCSTMKVIALISLPEMFSSRVMVFFDEAYYADFFNRTGDVQVWSPLPVERNLAVEWGLSFPSGLSVKGYHELLQADPSDPDTHDYTGEIWAIGEL